GRNSNPLSNFLWWISHLFSTTRLEPRGSLDPDLLEEVLASLDEAVIGRPPSEGGLKLEDGELVIEEPRSGLRIDRAQAEKLLLDSFLHLERRPVALPVREESPQLTTADFAAARTRAEFMLSAPVVLTAEDGTSLTFSVADLEEAFRATVAGNPVHVELGFDVPTVESRLETVRSQFESAPVDARFEIDGYQVNIVPSRNGTLIDPEKTAAVLAEVSRTSLRRGELPLEEGAEPEVTTADLEELDIHHLVSQFTTYHDCCGNRVTNIHLFADKIDGAIVAPGEEFSLNEYGGRRTTEDGFLPDGTIIGGEIVDTVGGGVSQFATTFYNAVFWGGYEDVAHKPHSFYI
ncbi:MAG TPA: VanW family protein, partial [Longimicrobiales bacterium]|nr:VanW family protein [Longimicrobiales bacterium]